MACKSFDDEQECLYITMEMSEERIAERIDANIMNVPMQDLPEMSKKMFDKKIDKIAEKTKGRLLSKNILLHLHMSVTSDIYYKNLISRKISNPISYS